MRALAGRRAALLMPNGSAFLVALTASEGRGAVLINPMSASLEIAYQIADANVGAVFTTTALATRLPPGMTHVLMDDAPRHACVVAGGEHRDADLGAHFGLQLEGDPDAAGSEEEAAIVYTSAMAGRPLGAVLTHRALLHNARATIAATAMRPDDHMLAVLPFAHLFGLTVTLIAPLLAGARVEPVERFQPTRVAHRLRSGEITIFAGVPAIYVAVLAALEREAAATLPATLRLCICGGAPLDPGLQARWEERTGIPLRQGYGLTEAGPVSLFNRPSMANRRGSLGQAFPGVGVSIRDPQHAGSLPCGAVGEICVAGDSLFSTYLGNSTEGLTVRDGWLHTGDLGTMDDAGFVTFRGVRKPMFTRNGFNIYPVEIEQAVAELERVTSARVVPVPSEEHDNDIHLLVTGSATAEEIAQWCEQRLSSYKQPSEIRIEP
ncbi:MAG TPA: AMP-binding protein [Gemmatimonadaceae bacterium]|nr:AMP-binding protein [Gemmatimonadaceae bacterium]